MSTILFFLLGFFYYWIFQILQLPSFFKGFIFVWISGFIIALIYVAVYVIGGAAEVLCWGTAVKFVD